MNQFLDIFANSSQSQNLMPNDRMELILLVGIAIVTGIMWQIPSGKIILYPLTLLSTWYHEIAHGLMAVLLGANF